MRYLLACLVTVGCGAPPKPLTEIETVPTNAVEEPKPVTVTGKGGFRSYEGLPIPGDSEDHGAGSGSTHKFAVMRPRDTVHDELVPHMRSEGWRIRYVGADGRTKVDEKALVMNGYQFYAAKGDKVHFVSVTGFTLDGGKEVTGISLTMQPVNEKNEPMKPSDL
jgi:hypothetical protein